MSAIANPKKMKWLRREAPTEMRVNLLFGFLGSGKTTLARRLLKEGGGDRKLAVIVNEFGEVGIDGAILEGKDIDMVELTSGCLCCTLKGSLLNAVEELNAKKDIDVVVIEATGVAEPEEMIETFSEPTFRDHYEIGPMVSVIDIPKFTRLREMLGPFYEAQVKNADVLVLNKIDLASAEDLETARRAVVELNDTAELLFTEQCDLNVEEILAGTTSQKMLSYLAREDSAASDNHHGHDHDNDHDHDHNHDHDHGHDHRHAPAQSFVLNSSGDASRGALEAYFEALPENVWRVKGFTYVDGAPVLVQYTMGQLVIEEAEPRENHHMVFIGPDMDQTSIESGFGELFNREASDQAAQ